MDRHLRRLGRSKGEFRQNTCEEQSAVTELMTDAWLQHWTLDSDVSLETGDGGKHSSCLWKVSSAASAPRAILTPDLGTPWWSSVQANLGSCQSLGVWNNKGVQSFWEVALHFQLRAPTLEDFLSTGRRPMCWKAKNAHNCPLFI